MTRIANDLQAYYVLGYYTTNTKWDGEVRSIKVRLKPKRTGDPRARASIARRRRRRLPRCRARPVPRVAAPAAEPSPVDLALRALDRPAAEPAALPSGDLIGSADGLSHRCRGCRREPVDVLHFARTDRIRIEWTVAGARSTAAPCALLDRTGKPLPVEVPPLGSEAGGPVIVELPLSAFAPGDYVIELRVASATIVERKPARLQGPVTR